VCVVSASRRPWAGALSGDVGELPVEVDVGQLEPAQLRHPHAGVEQQPQDDLVAAAEEDGPVERSGPAAGDYTGREQGGDLVVGEAGAADRVGTR
jgi:hypothetical protein